MFRRTEAVAVFPCEFCDICDISRRHYFPTSLSQYFRTLFCKDKRSNKSDWPDRFTWLLDKSRSIPCICLTMAGEIGKVNDYYENSLGRKRIPNVFGKTTHFGEEPRRFRTHPLRIVPAGFWDRKLKDMNIGSLFSHQKWRTGFRETKVRLWNYKGAHPFMSLTLYGIVIAFVGMSKYYVFPRVNRTHAEFH
eukprot:g16150.t1